MNSQQMIEWIDNASYQELSTKNKSAKVGDPFFQGKVGAYFLKMMAEKRKQACQAGHVSASKAIGW